MNPKRLPVVVEALLYVALLSALLALHFDALTADTPKTTASKFIYQDF